MRQASISKICNANNSMAKQSLNKAVYSSFSDNTMAQFLLSLFRPSSSSSFSSPALVNLLFSLILHCDMSRPEEQFRVR